MRKLSLFPAALIVVLVLLQSCSKQSMNQIVAPMRTNLVNATIAPNGTYQLSIENPGNISISMQASHFKISQTEPGSKNGVIIYKYIPAADYRGSDEVVLSNTKTIITTGAIVTSGSSGCSGNHTINSNNTTSSTSYTTVKINIAD
jgi:hypothetical protein